MDLKEYQKKYGITEVEEDNSPVVGQVVDSKRGIIQEESVFGKYLSGGLVDTKELGSALKVEAAQAVTGIQQQPFSALDKLRRGAGDFVVEALAGPFALTGNYVARKVFGVERPTPIADATTKMLDKHPYIKQLVDEKSSGLGGEELEKLKFDWVRNITPEEEAISREWAQSDPFSADSVGEAIGDVVKLVVSQTDILVSLASYQALSIHDKMYEETMQNAKAQFDMRGWEFNAEEWKNYADASASLQDGFEIISGGVSLAAIAGKSTFKKLMGKATGSKALELAKVGGSMALASGLEGVTEGTQSLASALTVNAMLNKYAADNGIEANPMSDDEIKQQVEEGFKLGLATGGGTQIATVPQQIARALYEGDFERVRKQKVKDTSPEDVDAMVKTYKDTAQTYGEEAIQKSDVALLEVLAKEDIQVLYDMTRALSLPVRNGTREELTQLLLENKSNLPQYRDLALSHVLETINLHEESALNKHFYKWMAQGDIRHEDIVPIKTLLETMLENSNLDMSLDQFFEDLMKLQGGGRILEYNQLGEWFVFGTDAFDIEKADTLIANEPVDTVEGPPADAKKLNYGMVKLEEERIQNADYVTYPIIIGTLPNGNAILLDGNHRVEKALRDGAPSVKAYKLNEEQTRSIAHEDSMSFNQAHGFHGGRGQDGRPFANFDLSYEKTGEGAHAFGWGVYLTEKFGIGKGYARSVDIRRSANMVLVDGLNNPTLQRYRKRNPHLNKEELLNHAIADTRKKQEKQKHNLQEWDKREGEYSETEFLQTQDDIRRSIVSLGVRLGELQTLSATDLGFTQADSFVYKVTIFPGMEPHEYNLLSWYDPVPQNLLDKLAESEDSVLQDIGSMDGTAMTGAELYENIEVVEGSKKGASLLLLENGIDGIIYPAESLSGKRTKLEDGANNFVIFDEKQIKIEEAKAYHPGLDLFQKQDVKLVDGGDAQEAAMSQRGQPETQMMTTVLALQEEGGSAVFNDLLEHIGDLAHRSQEREGIGVSGHGEKVRKLNRLMFPQEGWMTIEEEVNDGIRRNAEYEVFKKYPEYEDLEEADAKEGKPRYLAWNKMREERVDEIQARIDTFWERAKPYLDDYIKAHEEHNEPVTQMGQLGKDAAIALAKRDWPTLRSISAQLTEWHDSYMDAYQFDGGEMNADSEGQAEYIRLSPIGSSVSQRVKESKNLKEGVDFTQRGRTTSGGSEVIRGRLSLLLEGKFMIDLFKTGDILTLAHEFAHLFSAYLNEDTQNALVEAMIKAHPTKLQGGAKAARKERLTRVWNTFVADPFSARYELKEPDLRLLVDMQELLATSFEAYLSGGMSAPNNKMQPVFNAMRKKMLTYYSEHRMMPLKYHDVESGLAEAFDRMLSKEVMLPEDRYFEVTLKDEEGVSKTYMVNKSRPQIAEHRALIEAFSKADSKMSGQHEAIRNYAKHMLGTSIITEEGVTTKPGTISVELKALIDNVKNRATGIRVLDYIDAQAAKTQDVKRQKALRAVLDKVDELKKAKMPDHVNDLLENLLTYFDVKKRKYARVKKGLTLARLIRQIEAGLITTLPSEVRDMREGDIKDLFELNKQPMENLTLNRLEEVLELLTEIGDYNSFKKRQAVEERDRAREKLNRQGRIESTNNWRYKKGLNKKDTVKSIRIARNLAKEYTEDKKSQLDVMRILGEGDPNSFWNKVADDIQQGGRTRDLVAQKFRNFTRGIRKGLPEHGVSTTLGRVLPSEMIPIEMNRVGRDEVVRTPKPPGSSGIYDHTYKYLKTQKVNITIGQLMLIYGWSQNTKARNKMLRGGLRIESEGLEELFQFTSEEALYTGLAKLDQRYKDVVDKVIDYYENVVYPLLNEVYMANNLGMSLPKEKRYLPLFTEGMDRAVAEFISMDNIGQKQGHWYRQHIQSLSFLNLRVKGSNPLYAKDFFAGVAQNLSNVAFYMGMSKPLIEARVHLFGSTGMRPDGTETLNYKMTKMLGDVGVRAMKKYLDNLESSGYVYDDDFMKTWVKLNNTARRGILNLSASISALQPISAVLSTNYEVNISDLLLSLGKEVAVLPAKSIKFFMELDPLLRERYERIPTVSVGAEGIDNNARRFWVEPTTLIRKLRSVRSLQDIKDLALNTEESTILTLMFMDSRALSLIYNSLEFRAKREGWDELELRSTFLKIVTRTQPMNDPIYTSNFLATKNPLYKMSFGVFQTARDAIRREFWRNWQQIRNRMNGQSGKTGTSHHIKNLVNVLLINNLLISLVQELFYSLGRDRDEEDEMTFFESWMLRTATNIVSLDPILGGVIAGTVNYKMRGWSNTIGEIPVLGALATVFEDVYALAMTMVQGDLEASKEEFIDLTASVATIQGKAWGNIERQYTKWFGEKEDTDDRGSERSSNRETARRSAESR